MGVWPWLVAVLAQTSTLQLSGSAQSVVFGSDGSSRACTLTANQTEASSPTLNSTCVIQAADVRVLGSDMTVADMAANMVSLEGTASANDRSQRAA